MTHTCYHCGEPVDPEAAFCPKCRAPQIRVPEGDEPATPPMPPGTPEDAQPLAKPVAPESDIHWRDAMPALALAAGVMVLASLHAALMALFVMVAVSMFAVLAYRRRRPQAHISTRAGAKLGAALGFALFFLMLAVLALEVSGSGGEQFRARIDEAIAQATATRPLPPGVDADAIRGPMIAFGVLFIGAMLIGGFALGGMAAAKLTQKKS